METDEKFSVIESRLNDHVREVAQGLDKVRAEALLGLQSKPDFADLETMAQKVNTKADFMKV